MRTWREPRSRHRRPTRPAPGPRGPDIGRPRRRAGQSRDARTTAWSPWTASPADNLLDEQNDLDTLSGDDEDTISDRFPRGSHSAKITQTPGARPSSIITTFHHHPGRAREKVTVFFFVGCLLRQFVLLSGRPGQSHRASGPRISEHAGIASTDEARRSGRRNGHQGARIYRGGAIPELTGKLVVSDWSAAFKQPSGQILSPTPAPTRGSCGLTVAPCTSTVASSVSPRIVPAKSMS